MATVKGIWVFNEIIYFEGGSWFSVNFTSNNIAYIAISDLSSQTIPMHDMRVRYFTSSNDGTQVYHEEWFDEAYRIIDFGSTEQEVSDEFYTWLVSNATLQDEEEESINGITIIYNGSIITTFSDRQMAILNCKGKKMTGDIVISYMIKNLISFTARETGVGTKTYQAEKGMTWGEWIESAHNVDGFVLNENDMVCKGRSAFYYYDDNNTFTYCYKDTIILNGVEYIYPGPHDSN